MRWLFFFLLAPSLLSGQTLYFKGLDRSYTLHIPKNYTKTKPVPLVIVLHGGGGNAQRMGAFSGFDKLADRDTFIAVYPQAWKKHWNDGRDMKKFDSQRDSIDDVGFISALIDTLEKHYRIVQKRIYVTGLSNGGMMSYRLGCELSDRIAAIAPVIANMPVQLMEQCKPTLPLPVLIMNGTADPLMPWEGGQVHFGKQELGAVVSTYTSFQFWWKNNHCLFDLGSTQVPDPTLFKPLPDADPTDGCTASEITYACNAHTEVVLYKIEDGGHNMPGCKQYLPRSMIGKTCQDFNGAEVIWSFFKTH